MLNMQLYEYNEPEAIICSHPWAAPHKLPATPAQQLLACCLSSPLILCLRAPSHWVPHLLPHVSAAHTPLPVPLTSL